jgi:hypothetical protein
VAAIPKQVSLGSKSLSETLSQELAVHLRPAHGQVMSLQVCCSRKRLRIRTTGLMLGDVFSQHGFAQAARTAVDQTTSCCLPSPSFLNSRAFRTSSTAWSSAK